VLDGARVLPEVVRHSADVRLNDTDAGLCGCRSLYVTADAQQLLKWTLVRHTQHPAGLRLGVCLKALRFFSAGAQSDLYTRTRWVAIPASSSCFAA